MFEGPKTKIYIVLLFVLTIGLNIGKEIMTPPTFQPIYLRWDIDDLKYGENIFNNVRIIIHYFVPLIMVIYSVVRIVILQCDKRSNNVAPALQGQPSQARSLIMIVKPSLRMLLLLNGLLFLTSLPFIFLSIKTMEEMIGKGWTHLPFMDDANMHLLRWNTITMFTVSSTLNPYGYVYTHMEIRKAVRKRLGLSIHSINVASIEMEQADMHD